MTLSEFNDCDALLVRAVAGDRAALERLFLDHHAELARRITAQLPASMQGVLGVDDILQQTYAQAFLGIARLVPARMEAFRSWLFAIAENRLCDAIRAERRLKRGGAVQRISQFEASDERVYDLLDVLADSTTSPSWAMARNEAARAVKEALANLPEETRRAIEMRYFEGRSLEEASAALGRTSGAVRGLIDRGKQKIRDELERASRYLQ